MDAVWTSEFDPVELRARVDAADPGQPLAGMTFGVKDNIAVAGLPTTAGCIELWRLPPHTVGSRLGNFPGPLGLGRIELSDGSEVTGFLCEAYATAGALDITAGGGWRSFRLGGHS